MIRHLKQLEKQNLSSTSTTDPILLCAADNNYVRPLAVMLQSAAEHLRIGSKLRVILFDGGIDETSWHGLKESLFDLPIDVSVIRPDQSQIDDLMTSHHITHTAYLRLLAAKLLPDSVDKVIYLDSDVLVQDDLNKLWDLEIGNNFCLAVPDIACPFVDSRMADSNYKKSSPYLAAISPIQNWRELGLDPSQHYFNSGVMVLNLKRWRKENVEQKLLACLRDNSRYVWCWDQYALNVVFAGQWARLPMRWNLGAHAFEFPDETHSPVDRAEFNAMHNNPAIIHYTTEWKPWDYRPMHPMWPAFFDYLDKTAWKGWRPQKPVFNLKNWWNSFAVEVCKRCIIGYRKLASVWYKRRLPNSP